MRNLEHIDNVVIKIGSSSLCDNNGKLNKEKILNFIRQIVVLKRRNIKVTLVSSGAINAGMQEMDLSVKPVDIADKQALAAIGQAHLMQIYEELFNLYDHKCAQILLNHDDFDDRKRLMNLNYALNSILKYNVVPIVNENDTLAVEEIKVGDNDTLASLLVPIVDADLLIIISDIDGLYNDNPHTNKNAKLISDVSGITNEIVSMAGDTNNNVGTGGMITKIKAAKIVNEYGCDMAIINGSLENGIIDLLEGKEVGTYFDGKPGRTLSSRNHWIMYRSAPKGKIIIDDGARDIISTHHTSLLPKGIISVVGSFLNSMVVDVCDSKDNVIARGISNYSSDELKLIKGKNTNEIESILHYKDYDEVIHADNLVICKGVSL